MYISLNINSVNCPLLTLPHLNCLLPTLPHINCPSLTLPHLNCPLPALSHLNCPSPTPSPSELSFANCSPSELSLTNSSPSELSLTDSSPSELTLTNSSPYELSLTNSFPIWIAPCWLFPIWIVPADSSLSELSLTEPKFIGLAARIYSTLGPGPSLVIAITQLDPQDPVKTKIPVDFSNASGTSHNTWFGNVALTLQYNECDDWPRLCPEVDKMFCFVFAFCISKLLRM